MKKLMSLMLSAAMIIAMASLAMAADYSSSTSGASGSSGFSGTPAVVSSSSVAQATTAGGSVKVTENAVITENVVQSIAAATQPVTFTAPNYTATINPATITTAQNISLGALPANPAVESVFGQYFTNNFASVQLAQQGAFGATVQFTIAPTNLGKLNTATLQFFSYNPTTNSYSRVTTPYTVNANGSLTFSTTVGNTIIITDGPITAK
ncbi:MAG: hypothetical protein VB035_04175 [Candidatus Fimivivens sp.]|nr:hypothetical protein [Candidatus Fimivivens sp.]